MITAFVNGAFDILHVGHIETLEFAKAIAIETARAQGMIAQLIVGINSDGSIKRRKGNSRPINNETDRAKVLRALRVVNEVHIFQDDSPRNLIASIKPTFVVKGPDYAKSHKGETYDGIPILICPGEKRECDTSGIVQRILLCQK